jgi:alanine racemase
MVAETTLFIDLEALAHNYHVLRQKINPSTKFLAVVKASTYGHEPGPIARKLEALGVDYFGVAYALEGTELRAAGIHKPILLLHPMAAHFEQILDHKLEPSLYSLTLLHQWVEFLEAKNITDYPVHIKFNSGLNRLGVALEEVNEIVAKIQSTDSLKVVSVFSHLGASDDPQAEAFTRSQIKQYDEFCKVFFEKIRHKNPAFKQPWRHMCNTSGVLNYPEAQYDMVRCGIGLYGYGNDPQHDKLLKPVAQLMAPILQIHQVASGQSVGYNHGFVATKPTVVASLPLGHADGLHRIFGQQKGFVWINGQRAEIIGNVCMDMLMVDVTQIECHAGDTAIIFDQIYSVQDLAEAAGTISYELLTGLSKRIKRVLIP